MRESDLYRIVWLSRPLMQAAESLVEDQLRGTGVTVRMRAVLEILHREGPSSVPDIGRHLHIQRQYVQVMVNETLTQAFTEKRSNPRSRRSPLIALTDKGAGLIASILRAEGELMARIGTGLDPDAIGAARHLLEEVLARLLDARRDLS